jgi:hypothetical protein
LDKIPYKIQILAGRSQEGFSGKLRQAVGFFFSRGPFKVAALIRIVMPEEDEDLTSVDGGGIGRATRKNGKSEPEYRVDAVLSRLREAEPKTQTLLCLVREPRYGGDAA